MSTTIGISIDRWGPACWRWLHGCTLSVEVVGSLGKNLPCGVCRHHFGQYAKYVPIAEPTAAWISGLHDDANARLGKPAHRGGGGRGDAVVDVQACFIDFIFVVAFVAQPHDASQLATFCRLTFPTVGLPLLPPDTPPSPRALFLHLRPFQHRTYEALVAYYIPPNGHVLFLPGRVEPDPMPCTTAVVVPSAIQSFTDLGATDGSFTHADVLARVRHVCPHFTTAGCPLWLGPTDAGTIQRRLVGTFTATNLSLVYMIVVIGVQWPRYRPICIVLAICTTVLLVLL